jgi:4-alpha-glucanotransferase
MRRASGVLLHITSLPSPFGIGDLGPAAYRFADFLAEARQSYWQILPLNPTGPARGNSPYDSSSAFAGNLLLISPELLLRDDLLARDELEHIPLLSGSRVDYRHAARSKARLLDQAFRRYQPRLAADRDFEEFRHEQANWLDDYALFVALKEHFHGAPWTDWPMELKERDEKSLELWRRKCEARIRQEQFLQHLFFKQWAALKRYCNEKNLRLIGDAPIYVSHDSADGWANPQLFKLDGDKRPSVVAGVPPDYFSATGQLWGNPVYRWDALKATGYAWWLKRLSHNLSCFDKIRLDHFRGFVACWEVPHGERNAVKGQWVKAAPDDFFAAVVKRFSAGSIFAEDLGVITPDVREAMARFGFAGMKVLLFAFAGDPATHPYAPHNHERNCVVYTGTHDTNTARGWFESEASAEERERLSAYIGRSVAEHEVSWELIQLAFASPADTAIVPMQDVLGLGREARMNRPGTTRGNWRWRLTPGQITPSLAARLAEITERSGRVAAEIAVGQT